MNQEDFKNKVQDWLEKDGQSTKGSWNLTVKNQNAKISVEQTVCIENLGREKKFKQCDKTENCEGSIREVVLVLNRCLTDEIDQWLLGCEQ